MARVSINFSVIGKCESPEDSRADLFVVAT